MKDLKIKIYSDGANINEMIDALNLGVVTGFTTNPTLMNKVGINDYLSFAKDALSKITEHPISFEVFTDDIEGMYDQAKILSDLGHNVFVKIPVMNTKGDPTYTLIKSLSDEGIKLNVTAIFTEEQTSSVIESLNINTESIISIFAGRIANAGIDPEPTMREAVKLASISDKYEILWASSREVFNIFQAERCGCQIITLTPSLIKSALKEVGKDLTVFSRETVEMFYNDALSSGFKI